MKLLSKFMLVLNPIALFLMVALIGLSYSYDNYLWLLIFPLIGLVVLNMKFYFYTHKAEFEENDKWWAEFEKDHEYLGCDYYSEFYRNKKTGEEIEI